MLTRRIGWEDMAVLTLCKFEMLNQAAKAAC